MLVKGLIAVFGVVVMLMNETKTIGKIPFSIYFHLFPIQ